MTDADLTAKIARIRADPDPIHRNRNRMLASALECLNNEGLQAFVSHTHDLIGCIILTFNHAGYDIHQSKEIIDHMIDRYIEILHSGDADNP